MMLKRGFLAFVFSSAALGFFAVIFVAKAVFPDIPSGIVKLESVDFAYNSVNPAQLLSGSPMGALYNTGGNVVIATAGAFEVFDASHGSALRITPEGNVSIGFSDFNQVPLDYTQAYKLAINGPLKVDGKLVTANSAAEWIGSGDSCKYMIRMCFPQNVAPVEEQPYLTAVSNTGECSFREIEASCSMWTGGVVAGTGAFYRTLDVGGRLSVEGDFGRDAREFSQDRVGYERDRQATPPRRAAIIRSLEVGEMLNTGQFGSSSPLDIPYHVYGARGDIDAPNNVRGAPVRESAECSPETLVCGYRMRCQDVGEIYGATEPTCDLLDAYCCLP